MPYEPFTLFYDGACPFCRREVEWLKRCDRHGRLLTEDIADPAFRADRFGLTQESLMGVIHGMLADGSVVRGMAAIRTAYRAVGLGWIVAPTGWPIIRPIADWAYRIFARNRVRWGERFGRECQSGRCKV